MTDFTRAIEKHLSDAGWRRLRQGKGDHEIWIDRSGSLKVTVDGKVRSRHLANKILKDAGIGKKF